jgi:transposase
MMKQNQRYTPEFRAEAVKLVLEQRLSQEEAARRLGIPKGTLGRWMVAVKGRREPLAPGSRSVGELEAENARLRKELAEARLERDILKKATENSTDRSNTLL